MTLFALAVPLLAAAGRLDPSALWEAWPSARFVTIPAPCLRHTELVKRLEGLEKKHRGRVSLTEVGRSAESRSIHLLSVGRGPRKILLWSQMHGDEPSATPALLDVADFLLSHSEEPGLRAILDKTTLLMVPMLNPDGAERYERRNAQAIDVNRDALNLVTPEGRLLKSLRETHRPELGFNLHDQNRRTSVGETGRLATISLLAVSGDPRGTLTPGRRRAKRVCSAIVKALDPFVPGGIGRYDEDWNPRAFGDNLTAWGTPVVLIESGGLPSSRRLSDLTRLNFVALLTALAGLARNDLLSQPEGVYESLPINRTGSWTDLVLRGGEVLQPGLTSPYRADVAFDMLRSDRLEAGCVDTEPPTSRITEIGDARLLGAGRVEDVRGAVIVPGLVASVEGPQVRDWLNAGSLSALARLGVVSLRWRVRDEDRASAEALARELAHPGLPALTLASTEAPAVFLSLTGPPAYPVSNSVAHVLDALTGGAWREQAKGQPFVTLLGLLVGLSEKAGEPAPIPLAPGVRASLLVLRGDPGGPLHPDRTRLEAVWIDGVEVAAVR